MCVQFVELVRYVSNTWDEPEPELRYVEALDQFESAACNHCKTNLYRLMFETNRSEVAALLLPLSKSIFKVSLRDILKEHEIDKIWEFLEYGKGLLIANLYEIMLLVQLRRLS